MTPGKLLGNTSKVRQSVRGNIRGETTLRGTSYCFIPEAATDGTDVFIIVLDAGRPPSVTANAAFISSSSIRAVTRLYQEYRYLPGTVLKWEPRVPITSRGNYWIAWCDNPEFIVRYIFATSEVKKTMIRSLSSARVYALWRESTTPIGPPRKRMFNIDASVSESTNREVDYNTFERTVQGAFLFLVEGAEPGQAIAQPYLQEVVQLRGLTGLPVGSD